MRIGTCPVHILHMKLCIIISSFLLAIFCSNHNTLTDVVEDDMSEPNDQPPQLLAIKTSNCSELITSVARSTSACVFLALATSHIES